MCVLNRSAAYFLLGIQINLCALTYHICHSIRCGHAHSENPTLNVAGTVLPVVLLLLAYLFESDDYDVDENGVLNVARHAFSCSMRSVMQPRYFQPGFRPSHFLFALD
jgi:hypothetical protein